MHVHVYVGGSWDSSSVALFYLIHWSGVFHSNSELAHVTSLAHQLALGIFLHCLRLEAQEEGHILQALCMDLGGSKVRSSNFCGKCFNH